MVGDGQLGLTVPMKSDLTPRNFQDIAKKVLVRDAINTLMRFNRPLRFELFLDREKGVAGWRASSPPNVQP